MILFIILLFTQQMLTLATDAELNDSAVREDLDLKPRIFGGTSASIGKFPYMVGIVRDMSKQITCGGTIISEYFIVSAAHCFPGKTRPDKFKIRAGVVKLTDEEKVEKNIDKIIIHEKYNTSNTPVNTKHDIALLKVTTPFEFNERVQLIQLPSVDVEPGDKCQVIGWGLKSKEGNSEKGYLERNELSMWFLYAELATHLQSANITVFDGRICFVSYLLERVIRDQLNKLFDPAHMICAGVMEGLIDSCKGDSGGPLVCNQRLYGVVSFGVGCGKALFPGVYTNVFKHIDWIKRNAQLP